MNQSSYDLSQLTRNGLTTRVPARNGYTLTRDGLLFAHFYTKVHVGWVRLCEPPWGRGGSLRQYCQ